MMDDAHHNASPYKDVRLLQKMKVEKFLDFSQFSNILSKFKDLSWALNKNMKFKYFSRIPGCMSTLLTIHNVVILKGSVHAVPAT